MDKTTIGITGVVAAIGSAIVVSASPAKQTVPLPIDHWAVAWPASFDPSGEVFLHDCFATDGVHCDHPRRCKTSDDLNCVAVDAGVP